MSYFVCEDCGWECAVRGELPDWAECDNCGGELVEVRDG